MSTSHPKHYIAYLQLLVLSGLGLIEFSQHGTLLNQLLPSLFAAMVITIGLLSLFWLKRFSRLGHSLEWSPERADYMHGAKLPKQVFTPQV